MFFSDFEEEEEVHETPQVPVIEVKNTDIYEDVPQYHDDDFSDSTFDTTSDEDDDYLQVPQQQSRPVSQDSISM